MHDRLKIEEVTELLGIEVARLRFLEMYCQDFLAPSRFEIPRKYTHGEIKILSVAHRLLREGVAPTALRSRLAQILSEPSQWDAVLKDRLESGSPAARMIAVTSGKGGVGKSNIALNLAIELVRSGLRIALIDGDLGVANLHLLAGLKIDRTLRHVVSGQCGIEEIIVNVPQGPDIIPGSSGIFELANLPGHSRQRLLAEMRTLDLRYDLIFIDTGAGVSSTVLDFVTGADFALVVTTPETTAITDAYALIKLCLERSPACRLGLVANRVRSAHDGRLTLGRISSCTRRFLGHAVLEMGSIYEDSHVRPAVNEGVPFSLKFPESKASSSVRKLAYTLRDMGIASPRLQREGAGFSLFVERCALRTGRAARVGE
ncbi:MAG: MinD/ParA family protein [Candidatus Lindowbacteria bacterium]|nr:MinD/ParA family protein [Candidatus Lindowbacteria bacterium]